MTSDLGSIECHECGTDIPPEAEHYPHQPDCTLGQVGWCTCHHPVHPDCCTNCAEVPW